MITSDKKIISNRQNAQESTGPKSQKGKAVVAQNSLKHGLLSKRTLLPEENSDELSELENHLRDYFQPIGKFEELLFDRVVSIVWRLARLGQIEGELLQDGRGDLLDLTYAKEMGLLPVHGTGIGIGFRARSEVFAILSRYEVTLDKSLYRALHELERVQAMRKGKNVPLPSVLDVNIALNK